MTEEQSLKPESDKADPPPLTEAYRKVHKQYGIFTALFLAWEFIGIDVGEKPLQNFDLKFKSPEAVPYVLMVLMFYFSYRLFVEWMQCPRERRKSKIPRIDYYVAHGIAVLALAIFGYQAITKARVAATPIFVVSGSVAALGVGLGFVSYAVVFYRQYFRNSFEAGMTIGMSIFALYTVALLILNSSTQIQYPFAVWSSVISISIVTFVLVYILGKNKRKTQSNNRVTKQEGKEVS